ncbi:MAG TPA: FHA domain-containing serine/threonine-protein kinase [Planctomycetota bacterium]|nr:FHA domain-containing serine/threonine-protein kinase [Planctomycetota bacterium]
MGVDEPSPTALDPSVEAARPTPPAIDDPTAPRLLLTFLGGSLAGRSFEFRSSRRIVLGRGQGCDVEVLDARVSRHHCAIQLVGDTYHVKDLGSSNGTRLNGEPVGLAAIESGDLLGIADTEVRLELGDSQSTRTIVDRRLPRPTTGSLRNLDLRVALPGLELTGVLGEGATSAVFQARRENGEIVAIKVQKISDSLDPEELERFQREAETAATLDHPHIVRAFEHGEILGRRYIVMEFIRGETVKSQLTRLGSLSVPVALQMARQVASALEYARKRDVVHRDVKPENIIIQADGVAKLVDFGLAKSTLTAGRSGVTRSGEVLGTLAYMSPEQLDSAVMADHRADIYSLGATLYHAIAGRTPFTARTNMDYFAKILREEPPVLGLLRRDVPPIVSALVAKCMRKRPEDRYQTAEEVERVLAKLLVASGERRTIS